MSFNYANASSEIPNFSSDNYGGWYSTTHPGANMGDPSLEYYDIDLTRNDQEHMEGLSL